MYVKLSSLLEERKSLENQMRRETRTSELARLAKRMSRVQAQIDIEFGKHPAESFRSCFSRADIGKDIPSQCEATPMLCQWEKMGFLKKLTDGRYQWYQITAVGADLLP